MPRFSARPWGGSGIDRPAEARLRHMSFAHLPLMQATGALAAGIFSRTMSTTMTS